VPLIAHFRLFADISEPVIEAGYASVHGVCPGYNLWHGADLETLEGRRWAAIDRFNRFIETYCRERGRILIDLEPVLAPAGVADLGARFDDFLHPALGAYDLMARAVEAQLGLHLRTVLDGPA
jgi:hypothetical protein